MAFSKFYVLAADSPVSFVLAICGFVLYISLACLVGYALTQADDENDSNPPFKQD